MGFLGELEQMVWMDGWGWEWGIEGMSETGCGEMTKEVGTWEQYGNLVQ